MAGTSSGGETKADPSGWTVDTLRAMFEARIAEMDRRYEQRFAAQEEAIHKSETATERRFESVNEFRAQLADQASRFMPRSESLQRHEQNAEKVQALEARHAADVSVINSRLDMAAGKSSGLDKGWALLTGVVVVVGAIVATIVAVTQ